MTVTTHPEDGHGYPSRGSEDGELVLRDGGVEGGAPLLPVGDQLVEGSRLEASAGQDVAA